MDNSHLHFLIAQTVNMSIIAMLSLLNSEILMRDLKMNFTL
jgi:hypothetical protein